MKIVTQQSIVLSLFTIILNYCLSKSENIVSVTITEISGEYSFGNYNGDFKVMSNPKLQSLTIGSIENESNNFMYVRNIFIEGIRICVFE